MKQMLCRRGARPGWFVSGAQGVQPHALGETGPWSCSQWQSLVPCSNPWCSTMPHAMPALRAHGTRGAAAPIQSCTATHQAPRPSAALTPPCARSPSQPHSTIKPAQCAPPSPAKWHGALDAGAHTHAGSQAGGAARPEAARVEVLLRVLPEQVCCSHEVLLSLPQSSPLWPLLHQHHLLLHPALLSSLAS